MTTGDFAPLRHVAEPRLRVTAGQSRTGAGSRTVRAHNRALVLDRVAAEAGTTRAKIAHATGLTRATVSVLVDDLLDNGLLVELEPDRVARGRPGSPLRLNPDGPGGLGVEVNIDYVSACVVDLTGAVRARRVEQVAVSTPRDGVRRAARLAAAAIGASNVPVAGAALALPGLLDEAGVLRRAPNLPRWRDVPAGDLLAGLLEVPLRAVDNEANLAALAEHWYGGAPADFVHVSGEIGVGGAIVLGGTLFRGVRGFAGELGHLSVDPRGPRCGCGSRGCLEQLAGQTALLRAARAVSEDDLLARLARGERRATAALTRAGRALGLALAGAVNLLDVPAVVLGGFYARVGERLVEPVSAELTRRVISGAPVQVRVSELGADAAMLGAAGTVVRGVIAEPDGAGSSSPWRRAVRR